MNHNPRLRIALLIIAIALLIALLAVGIARTPRFYGAFRPVSGIVLQERSLPAPSISEIEILWTAGNVTLQVSETADTIQFSATDSGPYPTIFRQDGSRLLIQFTDRPRRFFRPPAKDLIVTVPAAWQGNRIDIATVSGSIFVDQISTESLSVTGVSAEISLKGVSAQRVQLESVSGGVRIAGNVEALRSKSVSGSMEAALVNVPQSVSLNTVSGPMTLFLPEGTGFTLDFDTVSGRFTSSFPTTAQNRRYLSGDAAALLEVHSISAPLTLRTLP